MHARRQVVGRGLELDPVLRVERRQVLEEDLLARAFRRLEVDRLDLDQREVALAVLRRPDLARHRVAGVQVELPDLRGGDVDVVGAGQVVVVGRAQEAEAVGQRFEHALREDEAALLGARLQDLEDQLLLAHAGRAGHVELLRDLGELGDAHVLERRELDDRSSVFSRGAVAGAARAVASGACGLLRVAACRCSPVLSISLHSSSSPSPRRRRNRQRGDVQTRDSSVSQMPDPLAARELVDLGRDDMPSRADRQTSACRTSGEPGCRASTSGGRARCLRGAPASTDAAPHAIRRAALADHAPDPDPRCEIRGRDSGELAGGIVAAARVAVARQVDEVDAPAAGPPGRRRRDPVDVRQPRLAGRRARARELRAAPAR